MNPVEVSSVIAPEEELGRGVFSRRSADRARRSRVPFNVFLEKPTRTDLSVDRLSVAPSNQAVAIARKVGEARGATFYGWAVVPVTHAEGNERHVRAAPIVGNPYHANICLPETVAADREEQKRHAQELADASRWREYKAQEQDGR